MLLSPQSSAGPLVHRRNPAPADVSKADLRQDIYTEVDFPWYTIHLSEQAVTWIDGMGQFFEEVLKESMEAFEEFVPLFAAIQAYIDTEVESIKSVSRGVSDHRVKLEGTFPSPIVNPVPDPGYNPPGPVGPPDTVNGLRWWTVNSINAYKGRWAFTATNTNPDERVSSIYFSTDYNGSTMHTSPRDFRDTYAWTALRGHSEFDSGLDTCAYSPRTGMWWLFNGQYCARTNGNGDTLTWSPSKLTTVWRGLQRIADGEFGDDERKQWSNGISCATAVNESYVFIAGNRLAILDATSGDFHSYLPSPVGVTDMWPTLAGLPTVGVMDGLGPKALSFNTAEGSNKWFLVYHSTLFVNYPDGDYPTGFGYNFIACEGDPSTYGYYAWNAMFNYLQFEWPYPGCI
ncbi:hypothetical protein [Nocardia alba]|uniref:Hemopexin n=1 Tax=Nocardia alba TaxID=225051 RepID=A0A4R1F544_9NOCA|nr:hypothetical protein [Nocardia alba]TCJ89397.1 hypothetical protein DFR71_6608 [Nocardia alba]